MKKCRKCRRDLQDDWDYCPSCGASNKMRHSSNRIGVKLEEPLKAADWEIILGLPWDRFDRKFINDLFVNLNEPRNHIGPQSINDVFIKNGYCYRLIAVHHATTAKTQTLYKLFKTVPKE